MPLLDQEKAVVGVERTAHLSDLETTVHFKYRRLEWLIPALLCAVTLAQLLLSSSQLSQTADEATHLYSGYRYLKCGDLTVSPEHPPLAKVIAAAPLLPMDFVVNCAPNKDDALRQAFASLNWLYTQNWPMALARARAAISVFAVGLCLLVWISARRMFGLAPAIVAAGLLVFEPNVLAYSPLVLTDVPVTCLMLLVVLGFYLWIKHCTVSFFLLTALGTGLTLLTKHSGLVVIPILGVLAVADALMQPESLWSKCQLALRNLLGVALICTLAAAIVWTGYGLRFAAPGLEERQPQAASATGQLLLRLEEHHLMPQAYLRGLADAIAIPADVSAAFVAGKVYLHAPWFSTPLTLLIRSTEGMLAMTVAAVFGLAGTLRKRRREFLFLLVPVAVYLAACLHASNNIGIRYLLPALPFLLIAVAAGCVELAKRVRWLIYVLPCFMVLHAASSLHAYPNYLSYANDLWGGPAQAYKYLPWLDMGQAYPQAKAYFEQHPTKDCWFIAAWQWDPEIYGVPCQSFSLYLTHEIPPHVHGTIVVSSTLLTDVRIADAEMAAAFKNATPRDHIAGSALLVYEGDFDTSLDAAAGESGLAMRAFSSGDSFAALQHGYKAVRLAPSSPLVHANLCNLLAPTKVDAALKECSIAQNLLLADPLRHEPSRKKYLELVGNSIAALRRSYTISYGDEPHIAETADTPRR